MNSGFRVLQCHHTVAGSCCFPSDRADGPDSARRVCRLQFAAVKFIHQRPAFGFLSFPSCPVREETGRHGTKQRFDPFRQHHAFRITPRQFTGGKQHDSCSGVSARKRLISLTSSGHGRTNPPFRHVKHLFGNVWVILKILGGQPQPAPSLRHILTTLVMYGDSSGLTVTICASSTVKTISRPGTGHAPRCC